MSTAAKKLTALVDRLAASRTALRAKHDAARDAAAIALPEAFDDETARRALAQAVAADALEGTDTASALREKQDAQRATATKAVASATAKRDAARREVEDIGRELFELDAQLEEARRLLAAEIAREGEKLYAEVQREYAAAVSGLVQARAKLAAALALADAEAVDGSYPVANFHVLSANCKVAPEGGVDDDRGRFFFNADTMTDFARAHYERMRAAICGEGRSLFGRKAA